MNDIRRVLAIAARRLLVIDLLRTLAVTLTVALTALLLALIAGRTFGLELPWRAMFWSAGVGAAVAAIIWSLLRRARGVAVAREVDERANLKETISTAVCVAEREDPWSRVVVTLAAERARTVHVREAIPIRAPRLWPVPVATAAALALLWLTLPNFDLLGKLAAKEKEVQQQQEVLAVKADLKVKEDTLAEQLKKAGVDPNDLKQPATPDEPQAPTELRKAAIKKLTSVKDRLKKMRSGDKAQQTKAITDAMRKLKQPGPGPLDELSRAMMRGDFKRAQDSLAALEKQLSEGNLSAKDQARLKAQLADMAAQLEKLAEDRADLQKQLEKAGLSAEQAKRAAGDPEMLKKMLEQIEGMSDEQKQQLLSQCKAASAKAGACSSMGSMMNKMAAGMGQQGMGPEGIEGMAGLGGMLSDMEMMDMELDAAEAALSTANMQLAELGQCLGGKPGSGMGVMNIGQWSAGDSNRFGAGSGGPGKGMGANTGGSPTGFASKKVKPKSQTGQGPIIGSRQVAGDVIRGESTVSFEQFAEESSQEASEAIETKRIPKALEPATQGYFGKIKEESKKTAKSKKDDS